MPLSEHSVERTLSHTRDITARGYLRVDGLWDIEAEMRDIKSYDISNKDRKGGMIKAGEPIHNMWVRITVDSDLLIHAAEAVTDAAPFYLCGDIVDVYKRLAGVRIAPGWNRQVKRLFGGVAGCTHITELLSVMATVAFQTVYSDKLRARRESGETISSSAPKHLDTCHALASDGLIVKREFPDVYRGE